MSHSTPSTCISSAAELDHIISTDPLPHSITSTLSAFESQFLPISSIHRHLLHIKSLYCVDADVNDEFESRRSKRLSGEYGRSVYYRKGFERAFEDINQGQDLCFDSGRVHTFLDLGCSPGGFSNWILEHNAGAQGAGVTLADEDAKYPFSVDGTHMDSPQYHVRFDNVINLVMESIRRGETPLIPLTREGEAGAPIHSCYDLVIAGAFPILKGQIPWWLRAQLVLCQLLLIFTNLSPDGSCVIVICARAHRWIVEVISMLRQSFAKVAAVKAANLHPTLTSCYLVCRGFSASQPLIAQFVDLLQAALRSLDQMSQQSLEHEGDEGLVVGISGVATSPEVIDDPDAPMAHLFPYPDDKLFQEEHRFILDLFEPLWRRQYNAIHDNFKAIIEKRACKSSAIVSTPTSSTNSWRIRGPNLTTGSNLTSAFSYGQARGGTSPSSPTFPLTYSSKGFSPAANDTNWRNTRASEGKGSDGVRGARGFSGMRRTLANPGPGIEGRWRK